MITPTALEVTMSKSTHYSDFRLASFHYDKEINNQIANIIIVENRADSFPRS